MTVRLKIALTIFATGVVTALAVIATVAFAFQRFEHETTYQRATVFLGRVVEMYDNIFEMHQRHPDDFSVFLKNLVLFEPDTQLYLLDARGTVLASTGMAKLPPGFKVALGPVQQAAAPGAAAYVMGDDPERMDADAVIAARPVRRARIRPDEPVAGYLYLVAHKASLPDGRWQALQASFTRPALGVIAAIVTLITLLSALVVASVTRPLRRLTDAVAALSEKGLQNGAADIQLLLPAASRDEFGQLTQAFGTMLTTLGKQWDALRRLDHFRREAVSNLSHDLRSPLTATTACLEMFEARWAGDPARADDRRLAEVALRNTRNAVRLVQSLGDLAMLDEPSFRIRPEVVDLHELLADIALRFTERATQQGVTLEALHDDPPAAAAVDVELLERAIANLVDNALKFCGPGTRITLQAQATAAQVSLSVSDTGPGIPAADLPHLFDRFYQARHSVAPATGEGGKGLGLAIVKRIAELHAGRVEVASPPGQGTRVTLRWPASGSD
ncbi:MAG TPA: HAMP domain-containing sensor histidine kinase [Rhizobacter sp.]|nr:HAMP domain-containing sensor histidine kinase [Rhizobacter sp.]